MGVDVRDLSPSAQKQVLQKLLESNKGKDTTQKKVAQNASKYGNNKVVVNGIQFDSKREARRYLELDALQMAGEIHDLQRQVRYELIPAQRIDGKVVEKACDYVADFTYYDKNNQFAVEDTKGHRTRDYIIKRKLMLHVHGIRIKEV
jgi:hypothetical protein